MSFPGTDSRNGDTTRGTDGPAPASRYFVHTFGCQMNVHDSDRMEGVLRARGWVSADDVEGADLVVFNTCSVREKAEQKLRSEVGKLLPLKKARPDLVIAVAGCMAQQEGEKLLASIRHVDLVLGPDNIPELPALVLAHQNGGLPVARTTFDLDEPRFLAATPTDGTAPASAFVTTMKGCDERCSFCVVPYTRGPERYRPAAEIVDEVRRWVSAGAREVVLLGQTVDSYRDPSLPPPESDDPDESQFPLLLRLLSDSVPHYDPARPFEPGLLRLRYTSPHPRHATASLARAHAELDVLARHVHLPFQSGSDRVLKRMIRRYTRAEFTARAKRLLASRPGMTMSTDVIVGFPGETAADFEETLAVVREIGFVSLFGFKFSRRPNTPARKLADDVPEDEKSARLTRLLEEVDALGRAHLARLVGTRQRVLVEGASKNDGKRDADREGPSPSGTTRFQGRTDQNEIVHVGLPVGFDFTGAVFDVVVEAANKHSLLGAATDESLARHAAGARPAAPGSVPKAGARRSLPLVASGAR
ncbi:MAG: tRNA (N6-isopentenyl adenosine(37)-C2)-methylthiotransferase MiaB [Polyangiaceae bacterium]